MNDKPPKMCQSCWKKPAFVKKGRQLYCKSCDENRNNAIKAMKGNKNGQATQGK